MVVVVVVVVVVEVVVVVSSSSFGREGREWKRRWRMEENEENVN